MIIAQISDTHIALDTSDADQRIRDFERTVADLNALEPAPDVIVHTGDIVHNGRRDEYAQAVVTLAKARAPVCVMVGNKDNRANLREAFSACGYLVPGSDFIDYAIDDYPVRLIALDTLNPGSNKGDFCRERVGNLIDLIDAETTKPIAVITHHPPFEVPVGFTSKLGPFTNDMLRLLMDALSQNVSPNLLRVKGLLNIMEQPDRPAVLQGAQRLLHALTWLDHWPDDDRRSKLVFITQGVGREEIEDMIALLDRIAARTASARQGARNAQHS